MKVSRQILTEPKAELPTLPTNPQTFDEWQDAVDKASMALILATIDQGGSVTGQHEEYTERAFDLIQRGQALGIEPREDDFDGQ